MNKPYHILVIDDEEDMRTELVALLKEDADFSVETANDGEEGLKKLLTDEFDVALVDLRMPKIDGLDMIRQADEKEIDTYVIILTGKGDKNDAVQALKLQHTVKDWFDKSNIDADALVKRIKQLADGMPFAEIDRIFANVTKPA